MDFYKNFQGKVVVKGLNFRVEFRGENIKFHAREKGKLLCKGMELIKPIRAKKESGG